MDNYIRTLKGTKLFAGIAEDEICSMLSCLDAKSEKYKKGASGVNKRTSVR